MALAFRLATDADVAQVVALVESAYRGDDSRAGWTTEADLLAGQRTDAEAVAAIVAVAPSSARLILASDAETGDLLACCLLERRDSIAYFGMFAVRPGMQGGGIGKQLLAEAERQAHEEWDASAIEMTVIEQRDSLIAWYERRGYSLTGETRAFPYGEARFGQPLRADLRFAVLAKQLAPGQP